MQSARASCTMCNNTGVEKELGKPCNCEGGAMAAAWEAEQLGRSSLSPVKAADSFESLVPVDVDDVNCAKVPAAVEKKPFDEEPTMFLADFFPQPVDVAQSQGGVPPHDVGAAALTDLEHKDEVSPRPVDDGSCHMVEQQGTGNKVRKPTRGVVRSTSPMGSPSTAASHASVTPAKTQKKDAIVAGSASTSSTANSSACMNESCVSSQDAPLLALADYMVMPSVATWFSPALPSCSLEGETRAAVSARERGSTHSPRKPCSASPCGSRLRSPKAASSSSKSPCKTAGSPRQVSASPKVHQSPVGRKGSSPLQSRDRKIVASPSRHLQASSAVASRVSQDEGSDSVQAVLAPSPAQAEASPLTLQERSEGGVRRMRGSSPAQSPQVRSAVVQPRRPPSPGTKSLPAKAGNAACERKPSVSKVPKASSTSGCVSARPASPAKGSARQPLRRPASPLQKGIAVSANAPATSDVGALTTPSLSSSAATLAPAKLFVPPTRVAAEPAPSSVAAKAGTVRPSTPRRQNGSTSTAAYPKTQVVKSKSVVSDEKADGDGGSNGSGSANVGAAVRAATPRTSTKTVKTPQQAVQKAPAALAKVATPARERLTKAKVTKGLSTDELEAQEIEKARKVAAQLRERNLRNMQRKAISKRGVAGDEAVVVSSGHSQDLQRAEDPSDPVKLTRKPSPKRCAAGDSQRAENASDPAKLTRKPSPKRRAAGDNTASAPSAPAKVIG
eukprot:TRINITY_DN5408_c0_g1_i3.p1 TRINITY_DN5408_c0_g1~~TRINITY_DN5408_c0_g1_i3.p1  ORF type:complete len:730 (-),score=120.27 TRINITY_DN5408_c0_g1_i3:246-2435(-)